MFTFEIIAYSWGEELAAASGSKILQEFEFGTKNLPIHKCTQDDLTNFYPEQQEGYITDNLLTK